MAASTDNLETFIRDFYAERMKNDVTAVRSWFADEALIWLAGEGPSDSLDSAEGRPDLDQFVETLVTTWQWKSQVIHDLAASDNTIAVRYHLTTVFTPTGEEIDTELADFWRIEEGRITQLVEFVDTARINEMAVKAQD